MIQTNLMQLTIELREKVQRALGIYSANENNTPAIVFVSKSRALQVTAARIAEVTEEALESINNLIIAEDADFQDSVKKSITNRLERLKTFYTSIANNEGMLVPDKEFTNARIIEIFDTMTRSAEQLTQMYAK